MDGVRIKWLGDPVVVDETADRGLEAPKAVDAPENPTSGGMDNFLGGEAHGPAATTPPTNQ